MNEKDSLANEGVELQTNKWDCTNDDMTFPDVYKVKMHTILNMLIAPTAIKKQETQLQCMHGHPWGINLMTCLPKGEAGETEEMWLGLSLVKQLKNV